MSYTKSNCCSQCSESTTYAQQKEDNTMRLCSIASGSSGNCVYAGSQNTHILIDAGISGKRIETGLTSIGVDASQLTAVFITHEHSDHIQGLGILARRHQIPIFATKETLYVIQNTKSMGKIDGSLLHSINPEESITLGDMKINPFSISHDASNPVCYTLEADGHKVGIATDLGMYNADTLRALEGAEVLYVEANHDVNMLLVGKYPYALKQRILGMRGHLSNDSAARLICELEHDGLQQVLLAHLSKENNYAELAYETVRAEVEQRWKGSHLPKITVANRDLPSELVLL